MTAVSEGLINELVEELRKKEAAYENAIVKCAIIGLSGCGKSSLINAIAGKRIAEVSSTEQTDEPQEYNHGGLIFIDLPGCGTKKWPKDHYIECLDLLSYDVFILVTANRFFEDDLYLYEKLKVEHKRDCFVVRNKFDLAVMDEQYDNELTEDETRTKITKNIRENMADLPSSRIYLTSAREPHKYDLPLLINDILLSLEGIKRERFLADMAIWSNEAILLKRQIAEKLVGIYAGLAAANGINPIPGLDFSIDIGLLLKLSRNIAHIYGLTDKQMRVYRKVIENRDTVKSIVGKISQFSAKYLLKDGIILVSKRMAKRATVKEASKWIPFVGQAISACIAYKTTYGFGENLLDESESLSKEIYCALIETR